MLQTNDYQMLGVNQDASDDEIRRAYRKVALKYHPDHHPDDRESEETFKRIGEGYAVLSDPEKRKEYDCRGHIPFMPGYSSEEIFRYFKFDDVSREFGARSFRGFCGGRGRGCGRRGAGFGGPWFRQSLKDFSEREKVDQVYELPLTATEAYWGAEKQVGIGSIREQKSFLVRIPRGVRPGTLLRVVLNESKDGAILLRVKIV